MRSRAASTAEGGQRAWPLIGITSSELRRAEQVERSRHGEPAQTEIALGLSYPRAVLAAGGLPVTLAPVPDIAVAPLVAHLDGLVLSGGPDLHPTAYGQQPHDHLGPTEADVDSFELALCAAVRAAGKPVLGICRGLQVINVGAGGTLHQHLPDVVGDQIAHRQAPRGRGATHAVELEAQSRAAALVGAPRLRVNSFHHQAIDALGEGLQIVGRAPDGIVEAIEAPTGGWLLGVQWHAESLTDRPGHLALFEGLVAAARSHRDGVAALSQIAS